MPTFNPEQLHQVAARILQGAGVSPENADIVAGELKNANIVGHDSHGVMRLLQYVDYIEQGHIKPEGRVEVLKDEASFAIIDAHFQLGQVAATTALTLGIEKARSAGTATVVIRNCNHIGRLGSYTQRAAMEGFLCMMCVNGPGPGGVAPFGGIDRKLGTNPISISVPRNAGPLVLDMTSSATAEGKVRVALQKGETLPEGWIIDHQGNPSTNPADLYGAPDGSTLGAILPLGGPMGFKGYGLAVMIDFLGGILSGSGVCRSDLPLGANGVWMYLIDITRFIGRDEYDALVEKYVASIKSSRRVPGVDEILLPGEIELRRQAVRLEGGIPVADETWRLLNELATRLNVSLEGI